MRRAFYDAAQQSLVCFRIEFIIGVVYGKVHKYHVRLILKDIPFDPCRSVIGARPAYAGIHVTDIAARNAKLTA